MPYPKKSAFTLVELIVVIAVLAVLATIAFSTVQNVSSSARDSARVTDVSTIASKLEMQLSFGKILPKPENGVDLIASGAVVGYQGNFGTASARTLDLSEIKDPLNGAYYTYVIDSSFGSYQLLAYNENTTSYINNTAYADGKSAFTKGNILGAFVDTATQTPIEKTYPNSQLDIAQTNSGLTAVFSDSKNIAGTGSAFGGSVWNLLAKQSTFGAPASCPTGFLPVPGNVELLQPGFCVMKYEAKVAGGAINNSYGWHEYLASEPIVVSAFDVPVVSIKQTQAISACKTLWDGYHLLLSSEYMTLARNAESIGANWSSGVVGSGILYRGHTDALPDKSLGASNDDTQGYTGTLNSSSSGPTQKRTLVLSNGQIIWDLAGNVWEHTNKANTLNGSNHNSPAIGKANACGGTNLYSFYGNDGKTECAYQNNYTYANFGPLTQKLNATNGIGRINSATTTNNTQLRGGTWDDILTNGLFAADLSELATGYSEYVGFRCAK